VTQSRYVLLPEAEARATFAEHAPLVAELEARRFTPLCAIGALGDGAATHEWSVLVDPTRRVAVSIATYRGAPALYVVTQLEGDSYLETQWLPSWHTLALLGPAIFLDDRPARRVGRVDLRRTVPTTLGAHQALRAAYDEREIPWSAESYLRFRRFSSVLIAMNVASRRLFASFFAAACAVTLLTLLVVSRVPPLAFVLAVGAFALALPLFVGRACAWAAGFVVKALPLRARVRILTAGRRRER